jgi:hypothetical protein
MADAHASAVSFDVSCNKRTVTRLLDRAQFVGLKRHIYLKLKHHTVAAVTHG